MIINKINDYYEIKLPNTKLNIYDTKELEQITKKIIKKIDKKATLKNIIHLEFYINNNYGIIIKLKDSNSYFSKAKDKDVKITIHVEAPFLYQIEYFNIEKTIKKENTYYYKNKFYLEINDTIDKKLYLNILEQSEIIYEETSDIIDKGIKI